MSVVEAINGYKAETVRNHLVGLITARGLTVREALIKIYGDRAVSDGYKVLNGTRNFTAVSSKRWAKVLRVKPEELMTTTPRISSERGPLYTHVSLILQERGLILKDFAKALGHKTTAPVSAVLCGRNSLTPKMAARFSTFLKTDPDTLMNLAHGRTVVSAPIPPAVRSAPSPLERFSLVVNGDGTASVKMAIDDLPIEVALEILAALKLPALINPQKRLKITHVVQPKTEDKE